MLRILTTLLLTLLMSNSALWAQKAISYAPKPTDKSLLWKIEGKGLSQPSYLYGTIHLIEKKDFFVLPAADSAILHTDRMTFEINMTDMEDMTAMLPLLMSAFMRGDTSLSDLLSVEEYKEVSNHFQQAGLPMFMLDRIKPMFLSALDPEMMKGGGLNTEQGSMTSYEFEFLERAQAQEKEIEGLETAAFQMGLFDSIPYRDQAKMLLESVRATDGEDGNDQLAKMVELYKDQDIVSMVAMMDDDKDGLGRWEELLLVSRNRNWIPVMAEQMKEKPTFFAVGAGHLAGEQGVIALLRIAGYTVMPLTSW